MPNEPLELDTDSELRSEHPNFIEERVAIVIVIEMTYRVAAQRSWLGWPE